MRLVTLVGRGQWLVRLGLTRLGDAGCRMMGCRSRGRSSGWFRGWLSGRSRGANRRRKDVLVGVLDNIVGVVAEALGAGEGVEKRTGGNGGQAGLEGAVEESVACSLDDNRGNVVKNLGGQVLGNSLPGVMDHFLTKVAHGAVDNVSASVVDRRV